MAKSPKSRNRSSNRGASATLQSYFEESRRPLVMLAFVAPLALFYHFGSGAYHANIVAFGLLEDLARLLGVYGHSVPLVLLVMVLLGWHLFRHEKWKLRLSTLSVMAVESILMALPLFVLGALSRHWVPLLAKGSGHFGHSLALSAGAGVYEELVFRFLLCGLLLLLFKALALPRTWGMLLTIIVSSVLFSLYHYLGAERFSLYTFVFRGLSGAYLAGLFLFRGFGVTAASHTFYDVVVALCTGV